MGETMGTVFLSFFSWQPDDDDDMGILEIFDLLDLHIGSCVNFL
jgi:hypothetical protein